MMNFHFFELKDKVAGVLGLSHISPEDLQHEIHGPDIIKTYGKLSIEKSQIEGYYLLLKAYRQSSFRDFESYLRVLSPLGEKKHSIIIIIL